MAEQGLTPDTPFSGPTEPVATPAVTPGATPATAPTVQVGDKAYTLEEAQSQLSNYGRLQGEYTRASQELARARDAVEFANALEQHPTLRDKFIAEMQQTVTGTAPPQPGQAPQTPEQQKVAALEAKIEGIERERALDWARGQWNETRTKFTEAMGRRMSPQDEYQVQQYLDRTGAANLWSSVLAVFEPQFRERWSVAKEEQARLAAQAARGTVTEGAGAHGPEGPINWASASYEEQVAKARAMAGGTPDPLYNPHVDFGTQR